VDGVDVPDFTRTKARIISRQNSRKAMTLSPGINFHPASRWNGLDFRPKGLVDGPCQPTTKVWRPPLAIRFIQNSKGNPAEMRGGAAGQPFRHFFPMPLSLCHEHISVAEATTPPAQCRACFPHLAELQPEFFCEISLSWRQNAESKTEAG